MQKLTFDFKNHMRNLGSFRQAVESQKSWNSMGYFCVTNTFLQLKLMQIIYLTLLLSTCVEIHQMPHVIFETSKLFFTTQLFCIFLAWHTFYKSSPWKCKFSDFPLLALKFTKFLMSFFKQKVSFFSTFESLFSVMRENSSVLFRWNFICYWQK